MKSSNIVVGRSRQSTEGGKRQAVRDKGPFFFFISTTDFHLQLGSANHFRSQKQPQSRMSDLNEQQIQQIAEQVASQFATMRLQRQRNRDEASGSASHANAAADANTGPSGEAKVTELAKELGDLIIQGTTSSAPIDAPTVDPYASVPDPSVYEKDFVDVFAHVNLSVLAFEDPQLLVLEQVLV